MQLCSSNLCGFLYPRTTEPYEYACLHWGEEIRTVKDRKNRAEPLLFCGVYAGSGDNLYQL